MSVDVGAIVALDCKDPRFRELHPCFFMLVTKKPYITKNEQTKDSLDRTVKEGTLVVDCNLNHSGP